MERNKSRLAKAKDIKKNPIFDHFSSQHAIRGVRAISENMNFKRIEEANNEYLVREFQKQKFVKQYGSVIVLKV